MTIWEKSMKEKCYSSDFMCNYLYFYLNLKISFYCDSSLPSKCKLENVSMTYRSFTSASSQYELMHF
jgi:hypothetical protein